jgi:hypothetical protein
MEPRHRAGSASAGAHKTLLLDLDTLVTLDNVEGMRFEPTVGRAPCARLVGDNNLAGSQFTRFPGLRARLAEAFDL